MKLIAPDDYLQFRCIAGDCRHSCCIGWEIDIDDETRERYRTLGGPVGEKMTTAVADTADGAHFVLGEGERCPFLNQDGLCDIILQEGEGALCQICRDHPRFRNAFSDATEIGLGLCCEAAARQTLTREAPLNLCVLEDDGAAEECWDDELLVRQLREQAFALAQFREMPLSQRMECLHECFGPADRSLTEWAALLMTLERLDDAWGDWLRKVSDTSLPLDSRWDVPLEQLLCALIYRHLPGALDDEKLLERARMCLMLTQLVQAMFAASPVQDMDTLVDIVRMMSSEIEYSDENIFAILSSMDSWCYNESDA
ncbi:MAG: hypothetical protein E7333_08690 [Clostridiales bacterium]|nr:hypothetical protein [Clostridiales bacterium]